MNDFYFLQYIFLKLLIFAMIQTTCIRLINMCYYYTWFAFPLGLLTPKYTSDFNVIFFLFFLAKNSWNINSPLLNKPFHSRPNSSILNSFSFNIYRFQVRTHSELESRFKKLLSYTRSLIKFCNCNFSNNPIKNFLKPS